MDFKIVQAEIAGAAAELSQDFDFRLSENGTPLEWKQTGDGAIEITEEEGSVVVYAASRRDFWRGVGGILTRGLPGEGRKLRLSACCFESMGVMADCSRNAVPNPKTLKRLLRFMALEGYDKLQLYTEDTYVIPGQPYFGYLRGGYSGGELREIREYADLFGVELVPCIQTLAHLGALKRWPAYRELFDCEDILLAGSEQTYALIEAMFESISENFTSRSVNIGMDEAHLLGRGRYEDLHGSRNRFDVMSEHLCRVSEIAKRHGFRPMIWSDMFFRLLSDGNYYGDGAIPEGFEKRVPDNVTLIYWDYDHTQPEEYYRIMARHKRICPRVVFAGGLWKWAGFAPNYAKSTAAASAAIAACRRNGIREFLMTLWGDNGNECSLDTVYPMLHFCSAEACGERDAEAGFDRLTGARYADFMALERLKAEDNRVSVNPDKYLLYNDCFLGAFDSTVGASDAERYAETERLLREAGGRNGAFNPLFRLLAELAGILKYKCDLGILTRRAFRTGDRELLARIVAERYRPALAGLDRFYELFRDKWEEENKPYGFEVQDIRLGGLKQRLLNCVRRLTDYAEGRTERIPELEADILDLEGGGETWARRPVFCDVWSKMVSANVV